MPDKPLTVAEVKGIKTKAQRRKDALDRESVFDGVLALCSTIARLRGQLDAAEQHGKILQEQRAAFQPIPGVPEGMRKIIEGSKMTECFMGPLYGAGWDGAIEHILSQLEPIPPSPTESGKPNFDSSIKRKDMDASKSRKRR